MKAPLFQPSSDARLIAQRLRQAAIGEVVTYGDLAAAAGRTVTSSTTGLRTALHRLMVDDRMIFGVVRGVGYKRLSDPEIVQSADRHVDGIRRKARSGIRHITAVESFHALSAKDQVAHCVKLSVLTAVAAMSSDAGLQKVEASVTPGRVSLPIEETLLAFRP